MRDGDALVLVDVLADFGHADGASVPRRQQTAEIRSIVNRGQTVMGLFRHGVTPDASEAAS